MSDVRSGPGVPTVQSFSGVSQTTPGTAIYINTLTGDIYALTTGDVVTHIGVPIPTVLPVVTGSVAGNAALASLLTALAGLGLITNSTSP